MYGYIVNELEANEKFGLVQQSMQNFISGRIYPEVPLLVATLLPSRVIVDEELVRYTTFPVL